MIRYQGTIIIAGLWALCDQLTKLWVVRAVLGGSLPSDPSGIRSPRLVVSEAWFHLRVAGNKGAAWSVLGEIPDAVRVPLFLVLSGVSMAALIAFLTRTEPREYLPRFALASILGGAAGNLVDRIRLGYVVDFIHCFHGPFHWPTFNVADVAIVIGASLLAIHLVRTGGHPLLSRPSEGAPFGG